MTYSSNRNNTFKRKPSSGRSFGRLERKVSQRRLQFFLQNSSNLEENHLSSPVWEITDPLNLGGKYLYSDFKFSYNSDLD